MTDKIPFILDTDPGVDDFFAFAFLGSYQDQVNLLGVTTVGGNNETKVTTKNALDILSFLGMDAPVFPGANRYLTEEFGKPVVEAHGHNGVGDVELPESSNQAKEEYAWDAIYRISKEKGPIVLGTIGPLTNIATAILKYPDLPDMIEKIVMMGGSNLVGNIGPYAEANIGHDPLAAKIVFHSGIKIDGIGLDTTLQCSVSLEEFDSYAQKDNPIHQAMRKMMEFRNGEAMHDAVAISTLIDDTWLTWREGMMDVVVESSEIQGMTLFEGVGDQVRFAKDPDVEVYRKHYQEMVTSYAKGGK